MYGKILLKCIFENETVCIAFPVSEESPLIVSTEGGKNLLFPLEVVNIIASRTTFTLS
jgi:hypothetical protein